jgi:hypothetical protein
MLKPVRVFRNHYLCDACETEFADEMLVVSSSFCPCCDAEIEPYSSEDLFDVEAYDDEEEVA